MVVVPTVERQYPTTSVGLVAYAVSASVAATAPIHHTNRCGKAQWWPTAKRNNPGKQEYQVRALV